MKRTANHANFEKVLDGSSPWCVSHGDCREVMQQLPESSVDAIVCDPPYGLEFMGAEWDSPTKLGESGEQSSNWDDQNGKGAWARSRTPRYAGKKLGNKAREMLAFQAWCYEWAVEALRVAKPGAHLLAFGAPRTYHRLTCALEDAGWEVRDCVMWIYGSGYPKSRDVSKAIDKAGGAAAKEQAAALKLAREHAGLTRQELADAVGCTVASVRDWEEGRARSAGAAPEFIVPSDDYREKLSELLGYSSDERRVVGSSKERTGDGTVGSFGHSGTLREGGNSKLAAQWKGWGSALKPSYEPVIVARKPLEGTLDQNVLQHGTGAINIDGCRVPHAGANDLAESVNKNRHQQFGSGPRTASPTHGERGQQPRSDYDGSAGRWPANVCHDGSDEVLRCFPDVESGIAVMRNGGGGKIFNGKSTQGAVADAGYTDSGSAARFFYCAKANRSERDAGMDAFAPNEKGIRNDHPTVKPREIMQWLVRLVTPPAGLVLDPFCGSGTCGIATTKEGFRYLGIEIDDLYADIARHRIAHVVGGDVERTTQERIPDPPEQGSLF